MKWFRGSTTVFLILTLILSICIAGVIIDLCTDPDKKKHMDADPNYNGTMGIYIVIILIQFAFITFDLFGIFIGYRTWANNFQLDHIARHRLIRWLSFWGLTCLVNVSVAIYAIVKGKEPKEEMAHLYDIFAQANQEAVFVAAFEKYQHENSCCGIYGPDDWLMVQLRSGMGGGGGGGGYQSLDYGFRQNPSTGNCHLTPPTIPMGCGKKMLEEIHFLLSLFAGLLIMETIMGIATGCLAGYCFYYWLDKEVIVIPEDEVSNLVIIEPESSTSTVQYGSSTSSRSRGGYMSPPRLLRSGSNGPYLGPPISSDYPRIEEEYRNSRRFMSKSQGGNYNNQRGTSGNRRPTSYPPDLFDTSPENGQQENPDAIPPSQTSAKIPRITVTSMVPNNPLNNPDSIANPLASSPPMASMGYQMAAVTSPARQTTTEAFLSRAGPFDANSRYLPQQPQYGSSAYHDYQVSYVSPASTQQQPFYQPYYPSQQRQQQQQLYPGGSQQQQQYSGNGPGSRSMHPPPKKERSKNHMLHEQEVALGGKVLGEMHVDHNKDSEPMNDKTDKKSGKKGQQPHHATIAIVRNKKAPKPKQFLATNE